MITPHCDPSRSWIKRFAAKKDAQFGEPGSVDNKEVNYGSDEHADALNEGEVSDGLQKVTIMISNEDYANIVNNLKGGWPGRALVAVHKLIDPPPPVEGKEKDLYT